jgi:hypothetical protein
MFLPKKEVATVRLAAYPTGKSEQAAAPVVLAYCPAEQARQPSAPKPGLSLLV